MRLPAARIWSANVLFFDWLREFFARIVQKFFFTCGKRLPAASLRDLDENGNPVPVDAAPVPRLTDGSRRNAAASDGSGPAVNRKPGTTRDSSDCETERSLRGNRGKGGKDGRDERGRWTNTNTNKTTARCQNNKAKKPKRKEIETKYGDLTKRSNDEVDPFDDKRKTLNSVLRTDDTSDSEPGKVPSGRFDGSNERLVAEEDETVGESESRSETRSSSLAENDSGGRAVGDDDDDAARDSRTYLLTPRSGSRSKKKRKAAQKNGGKVYAIGSPENVSSLASVEDRAADERTCPNFAESKILRDARDVADSKESERSGRVLEKSERLGNESPNIAFGLGSSCGAGLKRLPDLPSDFLVSNQKPSAVVRPCRPTIPLALPGDERSVKPVRTGPADDDDDDDVKLSSLKDYLTEMELERIETFDIISRSSFLKSELNRLSVIRSCNDLILGSNNDVVYGSNCDLVEELNKDQVQVSDNDLIQGSNNDLIRGSNNDLVQGLNNDLVHGSNNDLIHGSNNDFVQGSNKETRHFLELRTHEHPLENPPSSSSSRDFDVQRSSPTGNERGHRSTTRSVELDSPSASRTRQQSRTTTGSAVLDARPASDRSGPAPKTPSTTEKTRDGFPAQREEASSPTAQRSDCDISRRVGVDSASRESSYPSIRNRRGVPKRTTVGKTTRESVESERHPTLLPYSDYSDSSATVVPSSSSPFSSSSLDRPSKAKSRYETFDRASDTEKSGHFHRHVPNDGREFDLRRAQRFVHSEFDRVLRSAKNGGVGEVTVFRCD